VSSSSVTYLEEQVLEALDKVFSIAAELRLGRNSSYGAGDLLTATVTAILLVRAYAMYGYIDQKTCSELEEVLRGFIKAYLALGKPEAGKSLEELWSVLSSGAGQSLGKLKPHLASSG